MNQTWSKKMKTAKIVAAAVALAVVSVTPAAAQADEHAHHRMAMATAAPVVAAHPMAVQPAIGDLTFTNQDGRKVTLRDALATSDPVMVNFIFTSCTTICPVMSAGFSSLERRLAGEQRAVRLVSISIDPEVDTPARLKEYAGGLGAGNDWWFLTGTVADVEAAQRAFGAYRGSKEGHSAATFIRRTGTGQWEQLDGLASGETLLRAYNGGERASQVGGQK